MQSDGAGSQFKIRKDRTAQGAKPAGTAVGASRATRCCLARDVLLTCVNKYRDRCICHRLATSDAVKAPSARVDSW